MAGSKPWFLVMTPKDANGPGADWKREHAASRGKIVARPIAKEGWIALVIFVACWTAIPIDPLDLGLSRRKDFLRRCDSVDDRTRARCDRRVSSGGAAENDPDPFAIPDTRDRRHTRRTILTPREGARVEEKRYAR